MALIIQLLSFMKNTSKKRLLENHLPEERGHSGALELLQQELLPYDGHSSHYGVLAVWLGFLRALGMIHQSPHWQVSGDTFYGDHLLFEKLYKDVEGEVDSLGEKVVNLAGPEFTNYFLQLRHIRALMDVVGKRDIPPLSGSRIAEEIFVKVGEEIQGYLESKGVLTSGLANLMGDILDRHEAHVYLLTRRITTSGD